ncbi:VOC family protein [Helcococcus kunzii]|uniref:VOC family protein n=1 Tax=Helcococcus kunzii TaxID=40091 RepID=UPI001C950F47|nr:VOC family protein [Helcococcus kunzii]MCT1795721.1 VOC family protein [Helcococcus kunzii]MCT1988682.1 VOC family protein [Helcococcus kunzii]QZO75667.1 VOC family protein [Helcococcus kunzii]
MYKLKDRIKIKEVTLNVKNLNQMIDYYKTIGLELINKTDKTVSLGVRENVLLNLKEIDSTLTEKTTGLYHVAYLVPSRKDLANVLFSLLVKDTEIQGAADHGYSEAIYLTDPEGNGIEIYRDKNIEEWDINEYGQIKGVTEPLYADELLAQRDTDKPVQLPSGTKIGHIHLSIKDYQETKKFYTDILGFDNKYEFTDQAVFLAANLYHHDIALNIWNSKGMELRKDNQLGLDHYVIEINNREDFEGLKNNLSNVKENIITTSESKIVLKDNQNIKIKIILK